MSLTILKQTALQEPPEGMGLLKVLDKTGDTRSIWDPNQPDEVEAARDQFNKLKKKGYLAYRVMGSGDKGEAMSEFDPKAGKVILTPPIVGG